MSETKIRPGAATPERAEDTRTTDNSSILLDSHFNSFRNISQGKVASLLLVGAENAIPGNNLVKALNLKNLRELTKLIEQERKQGTPICASVCDERGYYLAGSPAELSRYIMSLDRRLRNISATRLSLEDTLCRMSGQTKLWT